MNERKKQVILKAHQLFIDKGFHATSINDILEYSGISKGTFYNYFSSKNELLMELFKINYTQLEKKRNELLIGQDPSDINIFIKQIEMQIVMNRKNKLISLFEEIVASHDEELKQFFNSGQLRILKWIYNRFIDLFGDNKKPYLLDCAIMFTGILNKNLNYYSLAYEESSKVRIQDVIRYSLNRIIQIVREVEITNESLFSPHLLEQWLPESSMNRMDDQQLLYRTILAMKKSVMTQKDKTHFIELLDFIYEELVVEDEPRFFLVSIALEKLKEESSTLNLKEIKQLEDIITIRIEKGKK
ncbi:TetR/AcrR family transcriptional regulator [Bacillus andreraoultii]|uniref:TetR/AcrR family transcriptional regulator n=1 Tax=Bacillus andreraoultii TaxID=1499685 RepID=UPI00053A8A4E|nr:TetR/AcrR family transcriptional regulator [Bacillus andreraoultii]